MKGENKLTAIRNTRSNEDFTSNVRQEDGQATCADGGFNIPLAPPGMENAVTPIIMTLCDYSKINDDMYFVLPTTATL
jgi:hypothetical protein